MSTIFTIYIYIYYIFLLVINLLLLYCNCNYALRLFESLKNLKNSNIYNEYVLQIYFVDSGILLSNNTVLGT